MRTARILLADTHQLIAEGLRLVLEAKPDLRVIDVVTDGSAALDRCQRLVPDLLLTDAALPGLDVLEVCRHLDRFSSPTRVLLTMPFIQHERMAAAAKYGAAGVVLKSASTDELHATVAAVLAGEKRFPTEARSGGRGEYLRIDAGRNVATPYSRLTMREKAVFKLLAEGQSVKQVALQLQLAPKTVDVHKTNLMRKLDVHDRSELIHFAFREGLISPAAEPA